MLRLLLIAGFLIVAGVSTSVTASDVPADGPFTDAAGASAVCPQTCEAFAGCAWSGEWRPVDGDKGAVCDCGIKRTRLVPGGVIHTDEDARGACTETCALNGDVWDGAWQAVPGAFAVCGCTYVSEYCPTDGQ